MTKYLVLDRARNDLDEIATYIAEDNPDRAVLLIKQLYSVFQRIAEFPLIGRVRPEYSPKGEQIRVLIVETYLVLYRVRGEIVEIVRLLSGYRDIERTVEDNP